MLKPALDRRTQLETRVRRCHDDLAAAHQRRASPREVIPINERLVRAERELKLLVARLAGARG